jgi:hypothetical protein
VPWPFGSCSGFRPVIRALLSLSFTIAPDAKASTTAHTSACSHHRECSSSTRPLKYEYAWLLSRPRIHAPCAHSFDPSCSVSRARSSVGPQLYQAPFIYAMSLVNKSCLLFTHSRVVHPSYSHQSRTSAYLFSFFSFASTTRVRLSTLHLLQLCTHDISPAVNFLVDNRLPPPSFQSGAQCSITEHHTHRTRQCR